MPLALLLWRVLIAAHIPPLLTLAQVRPLPPRRARPVRHSRGGPPPPRRAPRCGRGDGCGGPIPADPRLGPQPPAGGALRHAGATRADPPAGAGVPAPRQARARTRRRRPPLSPAAVGLGLWGRCRAPGAGRLSPCLCPFKATGRCLPSCARSLCCVLQSGLSAEEVRGVGARSCAWLTPHAPSPSQAARGAGCGEEGAADVRLFSPATDTRVSRSPPFPLASCIPLSPPLFLRRSLPSLLPAS